MLNFVSVNGMLVNLDQVTHIQWHERFGLRIFCTGALAEEQNVVVWNDKSDDALAVYKWIMSKSAIVPNRPSRNAEKE